MKDEVLTAVRDMIWNFQPKSILVTGHSLGGVLATLAAIDIKKSTGFLGKMQLYTFGQPRVGNAQFADYVTQIIPDDYYRVIHFTDPVPDLPSQLMGFKHSGTEIWYYSPMNSDNSFK